MKQNMQHAYTRSMKKKVEISKVDKLSPSVHEKQWCGFKLPGLRNLATSVPVSTESNGVGSNFRAFEI